MALGRAVPAALLLNFIEVDLGHIYALDVVPFFALLAPYPVHGLAKIFALEHIEALALGAALLLAELRQLLVDHLVEVDLHRVLLFDFLRCLGGVYVSLFSGHEQVLVALLEVLIGLFFCDYQGHELATEGVLLGCQAAEMLELGFLPVVFQWKQTVF